MPSQISGYAVLTSSYDEEGFLGGAWKEASGMLGTSYSLAQGVITWSIQG